MDRQRVLRLLHTTVVLIGWYCISSSIILLTKWVFKNRFEYPLVLTTFSNTLTTVWAFLVSRHPSFRSESISRQQLVAYVLPIGVATALEIGFSNMALNILTVSFGTILKGGSPVFTMLWGLILRIEVYSGRLCLALFTIAFGIALASVGEGHDFVLLGFIFQVLAVAFGGLRWAMTHVLLRGGVGHKMPPVTAILYTSPATALCVLPFAIFFEARGAFLHVTEEVEAKQLWGTFTLMCIIATLVFILLISEYWLVNVTSSLALSVAGVFKELLTIAGGVVIFKDHITLLNTVGFCICQLGIGAFFWLRFDSSEIPDDEDSEHDIPLRSLEISDELDDAVELGYSRSVLT